MLQLKTEVSQFIGIKQRRNGKFQFITHLAEELLNNMYV